MKSARLPSSEEQTERHSDARFQPRIVSLIASATEMVYALGLERYLVGRSHECDFPPGVEKLPCCTAPGSIAAVQARR